jgi:lysophospholipase L1-like esterase
MPLGSGGLIACLAVPILLGCGGSPSSGNAAAATGGADQAAGSGRTASGGADSGGSVGAGAAGTGGTGATSAPACGAMTTVEDGFVDVPASDPGIRYVGRLDFTDPAAPIMAFPAATIETRFEGDAIDMRLADTASGGTTTTAYYEVVVDSGTPVKLQTCRQQDVYPLARNLAAGMHTVRISKRTEASVGKASFLGFRVRTGSALSLPDAPIRRLEVVGDSITCGYGDEVSTSTPDNHKFTSSNENALLAYAAVTARALGADYVAVAVSGRGMVRNYGGESGMTGPEYYELALPDSPDASWDHTRYSPHVIVVNLGTNDFSIGLDTATTELDTMRADYRQTYGEFLTRLRELHPSATLIAAVGPMVSDSYPEGYYAWTNIRSDVKGVVDAATAAGDSNVFYLEFAPQSSPYGEDWHPTVATHQKMADLLTAFIREKKDW